MVEMLSLIVIIVVATLAIVHGVIAEKRYNELQVEVLKTLGFPNWDIVPYYDEYIPVKSRREFEKYDKVLFLKENESKFVRVQQIMKRKSSVAACFNSFLADNRFKSNHQYKRLLKPIYTVLLNASTYRISVRYRSPAGRINLTKEIPLS